MKVCTQEVMYPVGCVPSRVCTQEVIYPVGCVKFSWVYPPSVYPGGCVFLRVGTQQGVYSVGCLPRQVCTREGVNQGVFMCTNDPLAHCLTKFYRSQLEVSYPIGFFYLRFCSSNVQSVKAFCPTLPETPGVYRSYQSTDIHSCAECLTH